MIFDSHMGELLNWMIQASLRFSKVETSFCRLAPLERFFFFLVIFFLH